MQSPTASNAGPCLVTTPTAETPLVTETEALPAQREPDAPEVESRSTASTETETIITPQGNGTHAEAPAMMTVTHTSENDPAVRPLTEPSDDAGGKEVHSSANPSAPIQPVPDTNSNPGCDGQKAKKQDKGVQDGRKYVPSKKAMIDPLKMDMSKPMVDHLTSSQLSLQCIECHIIFSDQKSKVRHLKLNHPAEYEQCALRNALFTCYVCDHHFTNSAELMAHQKAHTEKKPFKCPICNQAFKRSSELTLHKKMHISLDGYTCTECGKPYKTMALLNYHRRTHSDERPYVCQECGKRFSISKSLRKHVVSHLSEGAEGKDTAVKAPRKKDDGAFVKYPCSVCKATFKSTRTRLRHMTTKHNVLPAAASNALAAGQQVKHSTPIVTPMSFCQPALLQVQPNGPLQNVDDNIDTEQIRRLIESLGNVQKVNQVVILGQVPTHDPPLEVQQTSQQGKPRNLNLNPPQLDFMRLKEAESKMVELDHSNTLCHSMEQTIILEPITPDGQLVTPSFSGMGSHIAAGEDIELTLVQTEQTTRLEGEGMHQILKQPNRAIQSSTMDQVVCQEEEVMLKQNPEQTVILELTPVLTPTLELEQSQTMPRNEIPFSLVSTTELEKIPDQTVIVEQETGPAVPPLLHTVELESTPLQRDQQDIPTCPFVAPDTLTQAPKTVSLDHVQSVMDGCTSKMTQKESEENPLDQEPPEKLPVNRKVRNPHLKQVEKLSKAKDPSTKDEVPSQVQTKQAPQTSELPVNVMSAQELVKVRKRKPARAFIFQGYMQELVGSMYNNDFQIDTQPVKRQRTKKSHLVKLGPQGKEKSKQKKPSQQRKRKQEDVIIDKKSSKNIIERKIPLQKKGRKGKRDEKVEHLISKAEIKSPSSTQDTQLQQVKEDARKKKTKKQKEVTTGCVTHVVEHKTVASPVFKKKKQTQVMRKDKSKNAKEGKRKKNLARQDKVKTSNASADVPGPQITQDALLLLKGHKQPQLKVYKLEATKASGQTQETSPQPKTSKQSKGNKLKHPLSDSTHNLTAAGKKKGGRPKKNPKALSLLSSLPVTHQSSETLPTKQKTTRKRKASLKVETEGVITSHSKRALECKDCGERFSEVSSLQKHKATVHITESPGLTYTNGNIFEGVSRFDLYQLPKQDPHDGVINAATDWDTEPEVGEMALEDRERDVSFPALIPSPSLPAPPVDVEMSGYDDKGGSRTEARHQSHTIPEAHSTSDQMENSETPQTKIFEKGEPLTSAVDNQEEGTMKNANSEADVQGVTDEDVKEDFLLEVNLVTVGDQNERHDPTSHEVTVSQSESNGPCNSESVSSGQASNEAERSLTSQTVSCSTHQVEVKEEEEEVLVQKKKEGGNGAIVRNATRGWRRRTGHLKRDLIAKTVSVGHTVRARESKKEQEECQVVYEMHPVTSDSEILYEGETGPKNPNPETIPELETNKAAAPPTPLPSIASVFEESPVEQVVFELKSVTTSVEEVMTEGGLQGGEKNDKDQSPGILLEKFLTSRQRATSDQELCLMTETNNQKQGVHSVDENEAQVHGSQGMKVEENISDPLRVSVTCQSRQSTIVQPQQHRDIRTVLVKEESTLMLNEVQTTPNSRHIRWNVEPVDNEISSSPLMESEETIRDCRVTPELNTSQCIFYPVKEEEREVLLGAAETTSGNLTTGTSNDTQLTEHQATGSNLAEADAEWQHPPDLQDFLLQSSDDEDVGGSELADPQLDSEAEVMAYFYKDQTSDAQEPDEMSENLQTSASKLQTPREENRTRDPIEYFSKYFCWETWVEIASCTNKLCKMSNPVTDREVAQFVGIHIAMGTLKFPSPRLYWEDLTKVPLVAETMPLCRFLELTRMLKLAAKDSVNSNGQEGGHDCDVQNAQQGQSPSNRQSEVSQHSNGQRQEDIPNDQSSQTDPLWKARSLLCRFKAGCQSLRRDGHYAVDQYPLPLRGKTHSKTLSLLCTTLIGFGGFLLHVDLTFGLPDEEDAVEQLVPKGSMLYLCKQELSTPAMLERLLVAGVHGAGRVGGARGQIGDEFVSSDGKLMLRRTHCGFILSTAGNSQSNMASLIDNFEKAQMSAHLSRDLRNLYSIPLTASAPTCWPQAVLWYLTDLALVNSWLLYRQDHRATSAPLTLMDFRLEVSKALILSSGTDTQDSIPPQPPIESAHATSDSPNPSVVEESPLPDAATRYDGSGHWPEQLGERDGGRCRFRDCQRTSRVLCLKCCVFLCISRNHNCFLNFHSQGSLGKQ